MLAARLMHLLPHESYVPALEALTSDFSAAVADAAMTAFRGQRRTPEWYVLAGRLVVL